MYVRARRPLNALTGGLRCGQNGFATNLRASKESNMDVTTMLKDSTLSDMVALSSDEGNEA